MSWELSKSSRLNWTNVESDGLGGPFSDPPDKSLTRLNKAFISHDRFKEERVVRKKLVNELKQKRVDNPDKRFYI